MRRADLLLLAAVATIAHLQALRIGFLHDDLFHYLHAVRFEGVGAAIREFWVPKQGEEFYRPLVDTTFALTYAVFGAEPLVYRACDLVLHFVCVLLAARLVFGLVGERSAALTVGLLLAAHPLPGRALDWTSDRYVVMATLFTIIALAAYARWRERGGISLLLVVGLAQVGALCSKESGAALPIALLVTDVWWGAGRSHAPRLVRVRRIACGVAPFVGINVVYFVYRFVGFGDLGGYRDPEGGAMLLPFGVGRIMKEAFVDLPFRWVFPLNRALVDGAARIVICIAAVGLVLALVAAVRRPRWRDVSGGIALGYALLLPSLPYFYIGRDLLKAYHVYPVAIGFGLAAWALCARGRWSVPWARRLFAALLIVYVAIGHWHAQSWIRATGVVSAFRSWVSTIEPPLDERGEVWVTGLPHNLTGALVIEPNKMRESLEVLLDRRIGPAIGLGYSWSKATGRDVARSLDAGGRLLHFDAATGRGRETRLRRGARPLTLVSGGRAVVGTFSAIGRARERGAEAESGVELDGRKGRFRWEGPAFDQTRFRAISLRLWLASPDGRAGEAAANVRWTRDHYSAGGISRLVRFPVLVDGVPRDYEIDLVRTGWVGEALEIDRLEIAPSRGRIIARVESLRFLPW